LAVTLTNINSCAAAAAAVEEELPSAAPNSESDKMRACGIQ